MCTESPATSYAGVLKRMKERIRERQQRASVAVNVQLLALYWEIGTVILAQQEKEGWGAKVIKRLASDLKAEFPDMTGFSERNLKYMRAFAEAYPHFPFVQTLSAQTKGTSQNEIVQTPSAQLDRLSESELVQAPLAQLSWSHHTSLLDKMHDEKERHFYILKTIENGWSRNVMLHQIK